MGAFDGAVEVVESLSEFRPMYVFMTGWLAGLKALLLWIGLDWIGVNE